MASEQVKLTWDQTVQFREILGRALYVSGLSLDDVPKILEGEVILEEWLIRELIKLVPPLMIVWEQTLEINCTDPLTYLLADYLKLSGEHQIVSFPQHRLHEYLDPKVPLSSSYKLVRAKRTVLEKEIRLILKEMKYISASLRELMAFAKATLGSTILEEVNTVVAFGSTKENSIYIASHSFQGKREVALGTRAAGYFSDDCFLVR